MCNFFSFVTDPVGHPAEYYFLDWEYRKADLDDEGVDSHSHICKEFNLCEDVCNKYEFNPLTKAFTVDQINSNRDDSEAAEKWANRLNFKEIVEPLIVKPIINPLELPKVEKPTDEQIGWLKDWASVWDSVRASVWASVWVYASTFFAIDHKHDYSSAVKLWESGLVPSFDGTMRRLHSGKNADIVYELPPEVQE